MQIQLNNCAKNNKSRFVFIYCSLQLTKGIFKEAFLSFILVGQMHHDIEAFLRRIFHTLDEVVNGFGQCSRHPKYD